VISQGAKSAVGVRGCCYEGYVRRRICDLVVDGVTLEGPDPVGSVSLRFLPGVDVLYGLNGAGKSRILKGLLTSLGVGELCSRGGLVHLRRADVIAETELNEYHGDELALPLLPWWQADLLRNAAKVALDARISPSCPWVNNPEVDWFTYLVSSEVWNRLVFRGLDGQLAARVAWAAVSQGHFGLGWWHDRWELLVCVRMDESLGTDKALLVNLEAAMREIENVPEDVTSEDSDIRAIAEAMYYAEFDPMFDTKPLLGHPWASVPLFNTHLSIKSPRPGLGLKSVLTESNNPVAVNWDSASSLSAFAPIQGVEHIETSRQSWLSSVPEAANRTYKNLLIDAPDLRLDLRPPDDWFQGKPPIRWWVSDPSGANVDVDNLSTAQKRWSKLAIQLALSSLNGTSQLMVLDEPEGALHPSAQRFLAGGIANIGVDLQIVVATHSAAFLDRTGFRLHHVHRGQGGKTEMSPLGGDQLQVVRGLGLAPSDLFQHLRVVVVVEGRHDEVVLRSAIGDDLDDVGAVLVPMRGAKQLSHVLDSRFVFDYSDAKVLIVVDNTDAKVCAVWEQAIEAASVGDPLAARRVLEQLKPEGEQLFLREFGIRAVERGQTGRISVHGLSRPDVLDYLPAAALVPKAAGRDWDRLRIDSGAKTGTAFKKWLREKLDFSDDDSLLEAAVSQLDALPSDFVELVEKAGKMARDPWWASGIL
jgi:energy-coupling factor transporter ATP-binding protein EcfA2